MSMKWIKSLLAASIVTALVVLAVPRAEASVTGPPAAREATGWFDSAWDWIESFLVHLIPGLPGDAPRLSRTADRDTTALAPTGTDATTPTDGTTVTTTGDGDPNPGTEGGSGMIPDG